jgi:WD40 repeat protein
MAAENKTSDILRIGFNDDYSLLSCSTDKGFVIYNVNPLTEKVKVDFGNGINIVEVLLRSNLIALTGGGNQPHFPPNKTMIWDDDKHKCIGELNFKSLVRGTKILKEYIVIVLEYKTFVYNLSDLKLLQQIETIPNQKGLCDLRCDEEKNILACPGIKIGSVRIESYYPNPKLNNAIIIDAHEGPIACMVLSNNGKLLATASETGTLIRVFNTVDGKKINEFRRGIDAAEIYYLAFNKGESKNPDMLVTLSNKGTVHIFSLNEPYNSVIPPFVKEYLPKYFNSTWSMKQYRFLSNETNSASIVGFIDNKTVVVVSTTGYVYKLTFDMDDKKTTECILDSTTKLPVKAE